MKSLINILSTLKACKIFWTGGEPTLHPYLFRLSRIASELGIHVGMVTNGVTLENVVDEVLNSKMRLVIVSLDGANAKTHDFLRGFNGAFEKTVEGIKRLVEQASKDLSVGVNIVLTRVNVGELEDIIDLAVSLGARSISVSAVRGDAKKIGDLLLEPCMIDTIVKTLKSKKEELSNDVTIQAPPIFLEQLKRFVRSEDGIKVPCVSGKKYFHINPTGEVFPCYEFDSLHTGIYIRQIGEYLFADNLREMFERFKTKARTYGFNPCNRCMVFYNLLHVVEGFKDFL